MVCRWTELTSATDSEDRSQDIEYCDRRNLTCKARLYSDSSFPRKGVVPESVKYHLQFAVRIAVSSRSSVPGPECHGSPGWFPWPRTGVELDADGSLLLQTRAFLERGLDSTLAAGENEHGEEAAAGQPQGTVPALRGR